MDVKEIIEKSGLLVVEFGELCGVSRVTVYAWMKGGNIHDLRKGRVNGVVSALEAAIKAEDLPLSRPTTRKVRSDQITSKLKAIVIKHLRALVKRN